MPARAASSSTEFAQCPRLEIGHSHYMAAKMPRSRLNYHASEPGLTSHHFLHFRRQNIPARSNRGTAAPISSWTPEDSSHGKTCNRETDGTNWNGRPVRRGTGDRG